MNIVEEKSYIINDFDYFIKIFGFELCYNDLIKFKNYNYIKVKMIRKILDNNQLISIYINDNKIIEKVYSMYYSCDMFYYLNQLEL